MNRAIEQDIQHQELRVIGEGTCGTVFEFPGTELAYKKGGDEASLWRDFRLTNIVHAAVLESRAFLEAEFVDEICSKRPILP